MKSFWFPLFVVACCAAGVAYLFVTENVMRYALVYIAAVVGFAIIGIWWVFFTGVFRWRSLLGGLFLITGLGIAAGATLRYDGSSHGGDPIRFVWKWTPSPEETLPELPRAVDLDLAATSDPDLADFPSFLGDNRNGTVPDPGLNPDWDSYPPEELWRIRVGLGWSAFAVVGERAVTQEQREGDELVTCYHVKTGQLLWSHRDEARFSEAMGGDGPRATPSIRDGVVYTVGATGILNALRLEDGTRLWSRDVLGEIDQPNLTWGKASSPLVTERFVIVSGGDEEPAGLIAYDRETGEKAWTAADGPASYSSPVLMTLAGKEQVVAVLEDNVSGVDPGTGTVLWRFDWPGTTAKASQPFRIEGDRILVTSSYGVPSNLIRVDREGGEWRAEAQWTIRQMKTKFSSAVVIDGFAYGLDEGKMICMNVETGERTWKGGRYGYGQNLLIGDDLILIQTERGDVVLVRPNPEKHEEIARISPLTDKTWNAPALAGRYLLVRNDREAVALKLP